MMIFDLIFGFLLVFAGRNLFWLGVGSVGFLIGVQCASLLGLSNSWMALLGSLWLWVLGIVLAVCFEWLMVVFGVGFLGGGYLLMNIFLPRSRTRFIFLVDFCGWRHCRYVFDDYPF